MEGKVEIAQITPRFKKFLSTLYFHPNSRSEKFFFEGHVRTLSIFYGFTVLNAGNTQFVQLFKFKYMLG